MGFRHPLGDDARTIPSYLCRSCSTAEPSVRGEEVDRNKCVINGSSAERKGKIKTSCAASPPCTHHTSYMYTCIFMYNSCMYTWDYSGTHSICVCVKISVYVCTCTLFFHMCTYTCIYNSYMYTWGCAGIYCICICGCAATNCI